MHIKSQLFLMTVLSLFLFQIVYSRNIDESHSPILVLPVAEVAQGISIDVTGFLKKCYHINFHEKFPEDLQDALQEYSEGLTFFPNSNFNDILKVVKYDFNPIRTADSLERYISKKVKTIILCEIDSDGNDTVILKAKAIGMLGKDIAEEDYITFRVNNKTCDAGQIKSNILQLARKLTDDRCDIGFSLGFENGGQLNLGNIPSNIRRGEPHPDDIYRPDIKDTNNPDNYFIFQNKVDFALQQRIDLLIYFRFRNRLNIGFNAGLKTSAITNSKIAEGKNLYRKSYIVEGSTGGDALIYYLVRSKERSFFSSKSFSLPIFITYPFWDFGKNREYILQFIGGTNLLLSSKITIKAEKGWDRYNERQKEETINLGDVSETKFFAGAEIIRSNLINLQFGLQFLVIYTKYQADFKDANVSLEQKNNVNLSLKMNVIL